MPVRPLLIDVPGGEEENEIIWGFAPDMNALITIMNQSIETAILKPYIDMLTYMRMRTGVEFPPKVLMMLHGYDLSSPRKQGTFVDMTDEVFSMFGAADAKNWIAENINSSIVGPGAVGRLGYLVNTRELSNALVEHHKGQFPRIAAQGGIVGIWNVELKAGSFKVVAARGEFSPFATQGLDLGDYSLGAFTNSQVWFWNTSHLGPYEAAVIDKMFDENRGEGMRIRIESTQVYPVEDEQRARMSPEGWMARIMELAEQLHLPQLRVIYSVLTTHIANSPRPLGRTATHLPAEILPEMTEGLAKRYIQDALYLDAIDEDDLENIYDTAWGLYVGF